MERIKKSIKTVFVATGLLFIFFSFLYLWYTVLGLITGTLVLILIVFLLIMTLTKFFIFPGANAIWRRWWQSGLETELCKSFLDSLHELKYALEVLLTNTSTLSHLKKNSIQLQESKEIFSTILLSYHNIEQSFLNPSQQNFLNCIDLCYKSLCDTVIVFNNKQENLWNILENTENYDWTSVTFEDFPENGCLKACMSAFDSLETIITPNTDLSFISGIVKEGIFSNLNLLRNILQSTFSCQQYLVPSEEGEVDCMIVKNRTNITDASVIIFCNPNGGLYEYSCYQNQWLEFYINNGIDICLWNYRGYGRTAGSPTSNSLRVDGQSIFNFLSKVKMYEKIGAHGESIGGMVASNIAKNNDLSFLFADRTFSSLADLVHSRLRLVNKTCFFCFSRWNDCCCEDFIEAGCYKVLSCDPKDEIIPEKSSLKAGVLAFQNCFQLEKEIFVDFLDAILAVSDLLKKLNLQGVKNQRDTLEITGNSMYISIGKDMDLMDDEEVIGILFKIFKALEIDAGGVALFDVTNENELKMWISTLQVWGSFLPIGSNIYGKEKTNNKLNLSIESLAQVFKDYEFAVNPVVVGLCRQVRFLKNGLGKILRTLESLNRSNTEQLTIKDESEFFKDFKNVGFLIPLNCGHNGKYSEDEKSMVLQHLKQAKFIY